MVDIDGMVKNDNRVDASLLTESEKALLPRLLAMAQADQHPCLKSQDGTEIPIPEPIFRVLIKVIQDMRSGRAIVLLPEDETFTTQAAANFLGMSRQHFVTVLESGQIPFYHVGSHRRVSLKDLLDYGRKRDEDRRDRLSKLFSKVKETGKYDSDFTGDSPADAR